MAGPVRACYPGSFNPFTIAHLAIVDAARHQCALDVVTLVVSERTLGKDPAAQAAAEERAAALHRFRVERPWLEVATTTAQLLADISEGFDWLVLGADKWAQIQELHWYGGSAEQRNRAIARLPRIAVVPRPPVELVALPDTARQLVLTDPSLGEVSSTAVRSGMEHWRA